MKLFLGRLRVRFDCIRWYMAIPAAVALLTCAVMLGYFRTPEAEETHKREKPRQEQPFEALEVRTPGTYLQVVHSKDLNPVAGEHYLLVFWFKLKRLPAEGETFTLLRKFDGQLRSQRGFRISLAREGDRIRPLIMWRNSLSEGGEYKFGEADLVPKQWTMFALSWNPEQYLGLHVGQKTGDRIEVSLLGGYQLALSVIPDGTTDMYIGSFGGTPFRGMFGPVAVISTPSRTQSLYRIFKEMAEDMDEADSLFDENNVKLLITNASSDRSSYHHTVRVVAPSRDEQDTENEDEEANKKSAAVAPSAVASPLAPTVVAPPVRPSVRAVNSAHGKTKSNESERREVSPVKQGRTRGADKPSGVQAKSKKKVKKET